MTLSNDCEALMMLELWGMWSTSSLPSLPGPLSPRVVELIICIKMDLALNNLQRLICHKTQTTIQHEQ